ncbi:MAG: hypothetical protein LBR22_03355 [Desulfovibrio sp.]|nr:hypothetical protein [Desulfovibrio sp.]
MIRRFDVSMAAAVIPAAATLRREDAATGDVPRLPPEGPAATRKTRHRR